MYVSCEMSVQGFCSFFIWCLLFYCVALCSLSVRKHSSPGWVCLPPCPHTRLYSELQRSHQCGKRHLCTLHLRLLVLALLCTCMEVGRDLHRAFLKHLKTDCRHFTSKMLQPENEGTLLHKTPLFSLRKLAMLIPYYQQPSCARTVLVASFFDSGSPGARTPRVAVRLSSLCMWKRLPAAALAVCP